MSELTERQAEALKVIEDYIQITDGISPTLPEIANKMGTTTQNAWYLVHKLIEKGRLTMGRGEARSITIVKQATEEDAA